MSLACVATRLVCLRTGTIENDTAQNDVERTASQSIHTQS